jgi:mRNA-degrading endonuclease RelE of RelBE toxin-antitoxin system
MTYRVLTASIAHDEIDRFAIYAAEYSDDFAREQFARLNRVLSVDLAESPNVWGYFYITGAPYRGYLFRVGRRTQFWIIYTVDEDTKTVSVLRFWNASKDPNAFDI